MSTLELRKIAKNFGKTNVLENINLKVKDQEFVVFVGPSGCGKSTLLRIIAGLEEPTKGQVIIDEEDVTTAHPVERGISMVFQSYALYPHLTVYENIAFPLRVQGVPKEELDKRVREAAEILQLGDKLKRKPGQLSGGQRQRVAIGRTIVRKPKLFLFDEPLSNLDAALRGEMRVELSQLHDRLSATIIYVTHDQVEAMTMATRIVVLNGGKVEQVGTPMELYHHPQTLFVAQFIGYPHMNLLPAEVTGVSSKGLEVSLLNKKVSLVLPVEVGKTQVGEQVKLGIRPENLELAPSTKKNTLPLHVDVLERLGGHSIVYGHLGKKQIKLCASLEGDAPLKVRQVVSLEVLPEDCHVFNEQGVALRRKKIQVVDQL